MRIKQRGNSSAISLTESEKVKGSPALQDLLEGHATDDMVPISLNAGSHLLH